MCTCVRARLCVCVCSNHNGYLCFKRLDNIKLKANDRGFLIAVDVSISPELV